MSPGKSQSAKRLQTLKADHPERYAEICHAQNIRYHKRKAELEEYWASGTQEALDHKEAYYERRREINRKSAGKKRKEKENLPPTTSRARPIETPKPQRVNRQAMTPEERRTHDSSLRRKRKNKKSRQKRTAEKKAHATYMRTSRLAKKGAGVDALLPSSTISPFDVPGSSPMLAATPNSTFSAAATHGGTLLPAATPSSSTVPAPMATTPDLMLPQPPATTSTPGPSTSTPLRISPVGIPPKKKKMRQHCYNTCSKMRKVLQRSFSHEESTDMSVNLLLRKTPSKRKRNLDRLFEYPEVQAFCKKKLCFVHGGKALQKLSHRSKEGYRLRTIRSARKDRLLQTRIQIRKFFMSSAIARVLPHKRFATKAGPGYILMTTVKQAHTMFQDQYKKKISLSLFSMLRPKNVRKLGSVPTETCLCITCQNIKLKIDALNGVIGPEKVIPPVGKLFKFILCPYEGLWPKKECIAGDCYRCSDRIRPFTHEARHHFFGTIKWFHWERRDVEGRVKLDVHPYNGSVSDLLGQLNQDLVEPTKGRSFLEHLFNRYWQQSQYDICKENLRKGQVLMVQDFAENRKASYHEEVKSAHFGKAQISMHPTVCFYRNSDGHLVRHVAMFFCDDIGHDYHAVHRYTERAIDLLGQETDVDEVIIWSDGAASQYKGKGTFADLSLYQRRIQRNFFGSEHGKGEADGETGRFSQALARAVAGGQYFVGAKDMVTFGSTIYNSSDLKKYSFILVEKDEIKRDRPHTEVATVPGTRSLHQVVRKDNYVLAARKYSCFCSGCVAGKEDCCISKDFVDAFDTVQLKPSAPLVDSLSRQEPNALENTAEEPVSTHTSTEYPPVGEWLEIVGSVQAKPGKPRQDKAFYANVVTAPEGAENEHFYVQFYKGTNSGAYILNERIYQIVPGTPEDYRWRTLPTPLANSRGHYFFTC